MNEQEAIKRAIRHFECMKNDAIVVLDSGFGTHQGESDIVYQNRKLYAELAISALEEIQQYRAIGTVEELNELKEIKLVANTFPNLYELQKTVKEYSKIGTVEECRAAVEKQKEKKLFKEYVENEL